MTDVQVALSIISGGTVGFALGLLGGGGSILAVPLLLYVVGIHDAHVVIGSTAMAVSVNAYFNLIPHARSGHVCWKPAVWFAVYGVIGATFGSFAGKLVPSKDILFLFAVLMLIMAYRMMRGSLPGSNSDGTTHRRGRGWKLPASAATVGALSGFFGIGGTMSAKRLGKQKTTLRYVFSGVIAVVAVYMLVMSVQVLYTHLG